MSALLGYITNGVPFGCGYAIVAVSLVLTYQATGVFNFAFGAQAYASAYVFAILTAQEGFPVWAAFIISVVIMAPALGLIFDRFLFRRIRNTNTTAKMVTGLALLVGIPYLLPVLLPSNGNIYVVDSVLFNANTVYFRVGFTPVTGIYLSAVVATVVMLVALVGLMRFTNLGLQMRGAVESRRLVQLDGVNADGVVAFAWALSSFMAGLAGVLLAPLYSPLGPEPYITLMVVAIAAAAWAVLRSMPIAALVAVLVGVAELILQGYFVSGFVATWLEPALPFIVLVVALLVVPGLRRLEENRDPMASIDPPPPPPTAAVRAPQMDRIIKVGWYVLLVGFVVSMLSWVPPLWEGVFNSGLAYAVIFLSITLVTGMAGQLSLAQATLAGVGAFTAALLAQHLGLNFVLGGLVGAGVGAVVAVVLAVLSLRLKGLGLALMTLAAALFFDNTVFADKSIAGGQGGIGLKLDWLKIGSFNLVSNNGHALFVLTMIILVVCVGVVLLVRKGSVGRNLAAMRGSETGAASVGVNLTRQRLVVFALAGAVAGIGGMLYCIPSTTVNPNYFNYQISLAFVVIVLSTGVTTVEGAINAGISFAVISQLVSEYAPGRLSGVTFVLFAFGALQYAQHPEGVLEYQKRKWTLRMQRLVFDRGKEQVALSLSDGHSGAVGVETTVAAPEGTGVPGAPAALGQRRSGV